MQMRGQGVEGPPRGGGEPSPRPTTGSGWGRDGAVTSIRRDPYPVLRATEYGARSSHIGMATPTASRGESGEAAARRAPRPTGMEAFATPTYQCITNPPSTL